MDLGRLGEGDFKRWCNVSGMVANESIDDRKGWDFIVELDAPSSQDANRDVVGGSRKVFVQVKSTGGKSNSINAKLSALKQLVDTDFPAFIVQIQYNDGIPSRARLLHVGDQEVRAVFKIITKREMEGKITYGDAKMSLSLQSAKELSLDGKNLRETILLHIESDDATYCENKHRFRRMCGFGPDSIRASFSPLAGTNAEELIDLMLGLRDSIEVDSLSVEMTRFGFPIKGYDAIIGPGTMLVERKPVQRGKITAISASGLKRQTMAINLFSPGIPDLPKDLCRFRAQSRILDIIFNPYTSVSHYRSFVDVEEQWELTELARALSFAAILIEPLSSIDIEFPAVKIISTFNDGISYYTNFGLLQQFTTMIASALIKFDNSGDIVASIADMREALDQNRDFFAAMIKPGVEFSLAEPLPDSFTIPEQGSVYLPLSIDFQVFTLQVIVRAEANKKHVEENETPKIICSQPYIVFDQLIERRHANIEALNAEANRLSQQEYTVNRFSMSFEIDRHE